MRERLRNNFEEALGKDNFDMNRFEQEVLFYLEKMDMSEERSRWSSTANTSWTKWLANRMPLAARSILFLRKLVAK